jgi:hypothetical protein
MKDGDIEIRIEKKYYEARGDFREKNYVDARTGHGLGVNYYYHWNGELRYIYVHHLHLYPQNFYNNGCFSEIYIPLKKEERSYYSHGWWSNGTTKCTYFWINNLHGSPVVEYNKDGNIRNKMYYKADGEKDYARCYWNGPRLPSSADGSILRKAIPIVNRVEAEEEKGCGFNLAALEDAVLREEDVGTL